MRQRRFIGFGIVALLLALVGVVQPATPAAAADLPAFTTAPSGVVHYGHGGVPVTVSAAATGTPAPTFTWYSIRAGNRVERGTGPSVTLGAPFEPTGIYYVEATNAAGTVRRSFTLAEGTDAQVTASPSDITVGDGLFVTFTSAGVGTPAPTMQWQRSNDGGTTWNDLPGATGAELTIVPHRADDGARFRVRYVNQFATSVSAAAVLTVTDAPSPAVVTDQPDDVSAYAGDSISFTAAALDYPGPLIGWQYQPAGRSGWSTLSLRGSMLTFVAQPSDHLAHVRAVFAGPAGTTYSDPATITLTTPVPATVAAGPSDAVGPTGSPVSYTVTPAGGPAPTVQWQRKAGPDPERSPWTDIAGATAADYSFTPTAANYFDQYRAVVTNRFGSASSSPAALILTDPPEISSSPQDRSVGSGQTARFTGLATEAGRPPVAYGWERSTDGGATWTTVDGAVTKELEVSATFAENGYRYRLVAANEFGSSRSASATLTVTVLPPAPTISGSLSAMPNGAGWFRDPVTVSFACSSTALASCSPPVSVAGDGAGQSVAGTAVDAFGQVATTEVGGINVDTTAPTISGAATTAANPAGGYLGSVTVHWTCSDATSGISLCPADQTVSGEGNHVVPGVAIDRAGNATTSEVTIRIDRDTSQDPGIVHGRITDAATGAPVAGVTVALYVPSTMAKAYSTVTATDGTYLFPSVADGTYGLAASKSGSYLTAWYPNTTDIAHAARLSVTKGSNRTVDQAIAPGYVLSGRLTSSATGDPISGATVRVQGGGAEYSAVTDSTGRYSVTGMTAATRTVTILAYGFTPTTVTSVAIPAVSSLDRALAPVPTSPGIKGTITAQATGLPLAGATVRVWVKGGAKSATSVVTDEDGRYSIPSIPIGDYEIDVVRGGYAVRWFGDAASRTGAATVVLTAGCTSAPDLAWGDPCATPVSIAMRKP